MSPCPDDNAIAGLLQGVLSPDEVHAVESHLDECAECSRLLAELARIGNPTERPEQPAGRYRMLEPIGAGGMGLVYVAYDTELKRKVAAKRLRPDRGSAPSREQERARFMREAQVLASLSHPNVLAIHDIATIDGERFIVMELIDGSPVSRWVRDEQPSWRQILDVYRQAGRGLAAAHAAQIVHRDVKPENILVAKDGRALVTDFGLAGLTDSERTEMRNGEGPHRTDPAMEGDTKVTLPGEVLGTPAYMAPEQRASGVADARSDQYSFCVSLRESLHGGRARDVAGAGGRTRVPGWLDRVLAVGLNRDPAKRYPSMRVLLAELDRAEARAAVGRRLAVSAVLLGAAGAAVAGAAYHRGEIVQRDATPTAMPRTRPDTPAPAASIAPAPPPEPAPATPDGGRPTAESARTVRKVGPAPGRAPAISGLFVPGSGPRHALESGQLAPAAPSDPAMVKQLHETARRHALRRNGAACLLALDAAGTSTDDGTTELRARCEMLAGRCDDGQRRLRSVYGGRPEYRSRIDDAVKEQAYLFCPPSAFAGVPERVHAIVQRGLHAREEHRTEGCRESATMLAREIAAGRGIRPFCEALDREQERASGRKLVASCATRIPTMFASLSECLFDAGRCEEGAAVSRFADRASGAPAESQARLAHERAERIRKRCPGSDRLVNAEESRTDQNLTLAQQAEQMLGEASKAAQVRKGQKARVADR